MNSLADKIQFRRVRDFGETIGVTTQFIYQNLRPLAIGIGALSLPFILLGSLTGGIASALMYGSVQGMLDGASGADTNVLNDPLTSTFFSISYLCIIVGWLLLYPTIHEYVYLYATKADFRSISIVELRNRVTANIGLYAGALFGSLGFIFIAYTAAVFLLVFCGVAGFGINSSFGAASLLVGGLLTSFIFVYILVALSFCFIVRIMEGSSISAMIKRCLFLTKGSFWVTFGLYFITFCICTSINGVAYLLSGVCVFLVKDLGLGLFSIFVILASVFSGLAQVITATITSLVSIFRYFSLVEKKEAIGFRLRIEDIGANYAQQLAERGLVSSPLPTNERLSD